MNQIVIKVNIWLSVFYENKNKSHVKEKIIVVRQMYLIVNSTKHYIKY